MNRRDMIKLLVASYSMFPTGVLKEPTPKLPAIMTIRQIKLTSIRVNKARVEEA